MKLLKRVLLVILFLTVLISLLQAANLILSKSKRQRQSIEKQEQLIQFAVMGDIHSDWENFRKALERAKKEMGDKGLVIVIGDLTTIGKKNELLEAKKILDESGLKYFVIPGNHDIWWGRKYKQDVWQEVFGKSFQSFKNNGVKFILINNADGEGGLEGYEGFGQQEWLTKEVEECLKVYCLVFMHIPLNHPNSLHVMGEENPAVASQAAELIKLFVDNKVHEVFAGHLHFSSEYELGGLKTIVVGAVTQERNFQSPKFLEVSINGETDKELDKTEVFLAD
jgi:predicted MPP superfamily phosphohydrolase